MNSGGSVDWRAVADVLAAELRKWGWDDYTTGREQEDSIVAALAVYERALRGLTSTNSQSGRADG